MKKGVVTTIGYVLFILGFLSILLSLVGLELTILKWLSSFGRTTALVVKLLFLFGGIASLRLKTK